MILGPEWLWLVRQGIPSDLEHQATANSIFDAPGEVLVSSSIVFFSSALLFRSSDLSVLFLFPFSVPDLRKQK